MKPFSLPFHLALLTVALCLTTPVTRAESAKELIASGDAFDRTFKPEEALKYYLPALGLEPDNVPLLVRIARQYRHWMTDSTNRKEQLKLGDLSLVYAQRAAVLAPEDSEAQLSSAISLGKMLPYQSSREQVDASPRIKAAVDKAIELNPNNDIAWHVLGRWHQGLADVSKLKRKVGSLLYGELPASTNEEAVQCFEKAIALNPLCLRHYIELGITYAQMGRTAEARTAIEKGLAMPNLEKDDPESKVRGREELAKLP